ncbi:MAG: TetR/AcrR family transcriptional regulator [Thalassolituus maritimus]|uniref:Transcriptional regulator, TetR family n=1 Tax=Thalassolituus maritimus TaxID=484498 RepID=A0A1N7LPS4_9GAMM|nr:TetR family transcriptional regulator [Thalassolituus maritimus]TPD53935.1 MAG: TetR/AcrR family transcriptional regulator [Thalassolituus maritimus]SIS75863.1 transcriptional regulator, TetR family [Thalassolituus maritimus]
MTELTLKQQQKASAVLDAAEALFASYGYHAVSVRDITGLAKVRLATVNDLFGGKEKLFYEVIKRRAEVVNALREERLAMIDHNESRGKQAEAIIAAFFDPLLEVSERGDGWRNYLRLVNQMVGSRSPVLINVIEFYNPITQKFLLALHGLYPEIPFPEFLRHWQFILATYFSVFADNFRVNSMTRGEVQSSAFSETYNAARVFVLGGLRAFLAQSRD